MVQHFCNQIIRHARFVKVNNRVGRQVEGRVRPFNVSLYDIFRHTRGEQLRHFTGRCVQMVCGIGGSLQVDWRLNGGIQRRGPHYSCQRHGRSQENQMLAFHNSSKSLPPETTFTRSDNQGRSEPSVRPVYAPSENTWLSYSEPSWLAGRHELSGVERPIAAMSEALRTIAARVTKE